MQKVTTFLTYNDQAEDAAKLYVSLFKDSKIIHVTRMGGKAFHVAFVLDGQEFMALNGGPSFSFAIGTSLYINCKDQKEVDHFWEGLSKGGHKDRCGWLTDKFGVAWQVIPEALGRMMGDSKSGNSDAAMQAMLKMDKIDIRTLEKAYATK